MGYGTLARWPNGPKSKTGREVGSQREYLRKAGYTPQVPRPRDAAGADPEEQEAFKKVFPDG